MGGTPARSRQAGGTGGYPPSDLARGYPCRGGGSPTLGTPCQTWLGGTPAWGTPPQVPPLDLAGGDLIYPTSGTPCQTWPGGYPCWGVPHLGWSTCYAAVGMPLAFTQEDFLVFIYFCKTEKTDTIFDLCLLKFIWP